MTFRYLGAVFVIISQLTKLCKFHLLHAIVNKLNVLQLETQTTVVSFAGWNDVGWHNEDVITPNLNTLAKEGVILDSSYVTPLCSP